MKLEFEDKLYSKFLILTKKRYMAKTMDEDGTESKKLTKRGNT
jgi:DNA polymerase elongation subunit (family B)